MSTIRAFFGFQQTPFSPTPDPRFLYLSPGHREALARLIYGVQEQKGFILLTGDVGTGKTTLLHALLDRLDPSTSVAFVVNSLLPFDALVEHVLEGLGIAKLGDSPAQRLRSLQSSLVERTRAGQQTVLILDEAQHLDPHTLEQVRLLSNYETPSEKTLQIILAGQPELRAKLDQPELRQLKQRIALGCSIQPLRPDETRDYVRTRLRIAGADDLGLFSDAAVTRIAAYSRGVPRVINTLCDHCLVIAYADQTRRIDPGIVEEAIADLETAQPPREARFRLLSGWRNGAARWGMRGVFVAAAAGLAWFAVLRADLLALALNISASSLTTVARSARGLLGL